MNDPRVLQLARNLVSYSIQCRPGDKVLVEAFGLARPKSLLKHVIREIYRHGGIPFVSEYDHAVFRDILMGATKEQMSMWARWDLARMKDMNAYIGIRSGDNVNELSDVPADKMRLYEGLYRHPVHSEQRVKHTKWVVLRYPNESMAQLAEMSTEAFADFYFNVCNLDYAKMSEAMDPLVEVMNRADKVRIVSPGTDLTFSIKGIRAIKCDGRLNIPDGEVYTAPVRHSVQGVIQFNTRSVYNGVTFENIRFVFENGKIVEATANDTKRLNEILDQDEGARYIGEFSLGLNPHIRHPINDILFDEKIDGSLHLTPGQAYEDADNGNRSAVHWDLVLIQRPEFGGGEIYFDDVLVRKDGRFVLPELEGLNPERLV